MSKVVVDTDVLADKQEELRKYLVKAGYAPVMVDVANEALKMVLEAACVEIPKGVSMWPEDRSTAAFLQAVTGVGNVPTVDILNKLTEATDILLHRLDYDGDGWEILQHAMDAGIRRSAEITAARVNYMTRGDKGDTMVTGDVKVTPTLHVQGTPHRIKMIRDRSFAHDVKATYPWNRAYDEGRDSFELTTEDELTQLSNIMQNPLHGDSEEDRRWIHGMFYLLGTYKGMFP